MRLSLRAPMKGTGLGVDLGSREIKVVEISRKGNQLQVTGLGKKVTPPGIWDGDNLEHSDELINALKEAVKDAGTSTTFATTAIPSKHLITRYISIPDMEHQDMEMAIRWDLDKYIAVPEKDLIWDFVDFGVIPEDAQKQHRVLLAAVQKSLVYQSYNIFKDAGILLTTIDIEPFAMWRVANLHAFDSDHTGAVVLVDIGAENTNVVIVNNMQIVFSRTVPVGGQTITNAIADTLGIDPDVAQKYQEEAAVTAEGEEVEGDFDPGQLAFSTRLGVADLATELRRSLDFHRLQTQEEIEYIVYLTGGTAKLKGVEQLFSQELGLTVSLVAPSLILGNNCKHRWSRLPLRLDPAFTIAAGLALGEVVE
ncbi:MAG: type IV pilus assembly protein PilM [Bacillota bacterium]